MEQRPPAMMIFSQAFQALILPAVSIPIFLLINQKILMKEHVPDKKMNAGIIAVIIFGLITGYFAIIELI
jgi:Mn2+/Fe2+ NRAMP family transporter